MRVAIVALSCPRGGMLHYATQLANAIAHQAEVHLFTPDPDALAGYLSPGIECHATLPLSYPGQRWRSILTQASVLRHARHARMVRACRPDVVHLVTDHPSNGVLAAMLGGLKVVFTQHDATQHPGEEAWLEARLTRWMASRADRIVVHAERLKDVLVARGYGAERITVIPHGDYGFLQRLAPEAEEEPLILCFGRLVRYKGLDVLCRAERLLAERRSDYRVIVAGEGDRSLFEQAIGPSGRVTVIDRFLPDAEVAALFRRARLVVLPYTEASQSGVLAIAFAFGKPAVVTEVGGLPEAVAFGKAGLLVPPNDEVALAEAIERLWTDPGLRQSLGAAGRRMIDEEIGWPIVAERHMAMYRELVGSPLASGHLATQ